MKPEEMGEEDHLLLAWLAEHGPDDWHRVVTGWNWDFGCNPVEWVVAQPDCDRATAQHVITAAGTSYYLRYPNRDALVAAEGGYNLDLYDMIAALVQRWNANGFPRSEIASGTIMSPDLEQQHYREAEAAIPAADRPWTLDESAFQSIDGRALEAFYPDGWPPELWQRIEAGEFDPDA